MIFSPSSCMLTLLVLLHVPGPATTQVTLTSLYPNHPSIAISTSSIVLVQVPLGHTGAIISCTGFGTPTPIMIKWIRIGQVLDARRIYSESISGENSAFVSARLTLTGEFSLLDVGDYSCVIQANLANNTELAQSYVISIESAASNQLSPVSIPIMCLANSSVTYFQFRVLNTDCSAWAEEKKQNIAERFMNVLKNAISAECQDCVTVIIEITNTPTCSPIVGRAAVFRGKIGTPQRERAFCALHSWIQYRPLVFLDGNSSTLHFLDYNCPIQTESLISAECKPTPNLGSSASAVGTSIVVILLLVVVVASAIIAGVFVKRYGLIGQQSTDQRGEPKYQNPENNDAECRPSNESHDVYETDSLYADALFYTVYEGQPTPCHQSVEVQSSLSESESFSNSGQESQDESKEIIVIQDSPFGQKH